jgi:hypothetical protein
MPSVMWGEVHPPPRAWSACKPVDAFRVTWFIALAAHTGYAWEQIPDP